jgi:hypothetical protein
MRYSQFCRRHSSAAATSAQEERALEVDLIEGVHFVLRRLLEGVVMGRSGVVDEEIETLSAKTG